MFGIVKPCTLLMVQAYANINGKCALLVKKTYFILLIETTCVCLNKSHYTSILFSVLSNLIRSWGKLGFKNITPS